MAHRLRGGTDDVRKCGEHGLDDGRLVELLVGVRPHRKRFGLGFALGEHDLRLRPAFQSRCFGIRFGRRDARSLLAFGSRDHGLCLRRRRLDGGGEQLLLFAVRLELGELGLLAHDLLRRLCLGKWSSLVGSRLGRLNLSPCLGFAK